MSGTTVWVRRPGHPPVTCLTSALPFAISNGYEECPPPPVIVHGEVETTFRTDRQGRKCRDVNVHVPIALAGAKAPAPVSEVQTYSEEFFKVGFEVSRRPGKPRRFDEQTRALMNFYRGNPGATAQRAAEAVGAVPSWAFRSSMELATLGYLERTFKA